MKDNQRRNDNMGLAPTSDPDPSMEGLWTNLDVPTPDPKKGLFFGVAPITTDKNLIKDDEKSAALLAEEGLLQTRLEDSEVVNQDLPNGKQSHWTEVMRLCSDGFGLTTVVREHIVSPTTTNIVLDNHVTPDERDFDVLLAVFDRVKDLHPYMNVLEDGNGWRDHRKKYPMTSAVSTAHPDFAEKLKTHLNNQRSVPFSSRLANALTRSPYADDIDEVTQSMYLGYIKPNLFFYDDRMNGNLFVKTIVVREALDFYVEHKKFSVNDFDDVSNVGAGGGLKDVEGVEAKNTEPLSQEEVRAFFGEFTIDILSSPDFSLRSSVRTEIVSYALRQTHVGHEDLLSDYCNFVNAAVMALSVPEEDRIFLNPSETDDDEILISEVMVREYKKSNKTLEETYQEAAEEILSRFLAQTKVASDSNPLPRDMEDWDDDEEVRMDEDDNDDLKFLWDPKPSLEETLNPPPRWNADNQRPFVKHEQDMEDALRKLMAEDDDLRKLDVLHKKMMEEEDLIISPFDGPVEPLPPPPSVRPSPRATEVPKTEDASSYQDRLKMVSYLFTDAKANVSPADVAQALLAPDEAFKAWIKRHLHE